MSNTLVDYAAESGIAIITLTAPPMNAVTHEMMKDLDEAILEARFDNDVHLVVITGQGEWFSAGIDVQMLPEIDRAYHYYFTLHANETLSRIENTPKLMVAALSGHAVGLGFEIALACDLRLAHTASGRISFPELKLGLLPGCGGLRRGARAIGAGRMMKLALAGESIEYEEVVRIGLVDSLWVVDSRESFLGQVLEYLVRFVPPDGASRALGALKRSVRLGSTGSIEGVGALDHELASGLFDSVDATEGIRAYLEERRALFQGK
jgi:enoyl-CoA hydratase